jgi:catechol 2,3-dioxygenase-like lactoylglutathione lyase family enzyme
VAERRAEEARAARVMTGPPGAVPILTCRDLDSSLRFYAGLGLRAEELPGYAVLRDGPVEVHLSQTVRAAPGGCLIRVPDAAARWRRWNGRGALGPLDAGNPDMVRFTLIDPDGNQLIFVSACP